jgi:two-component sensor histidine kinase
MEWHASHRFPCEPESSRSARRFCAEQLVAVFGEAIVELDSFDTAALVVSELITNSVNAGSILICLNLRVAASALRITVHDDADGLPSQRDAQSADVHGRGLAIIDSLCTEWGVTVAGDGKRVWADVELPPELSHVA